MFLKPYLSTDKNQYHYYHFLMSHSVHRVKIMVEKVPEILAESLCLR